MGAPPEQKMEFRSQATRGRGRRLRRGSGASANLLASGQTSTIQQTQHLQDEPAEVLHAAGVDGQQRSGVGAPAVVAVDNGWGPPYLSQTDEDGSTPHPAGGAPGQKAKKRPGQVGKVCQCTAGSLC